MILRILRFPPRRLCAYALLSLSIVYCQSSGDDATGSANTGGGSQAGSGGSGGSSTGSGGAGGSNSGGSAQAGSGGSAGPDAGTAGGGGAAGAGGAAGTGGATGAGGGTPNDGGPRDGSAPPDAARAADAGNDIAATSSDATAPYNPCPPVGQPCRIFPLGDSITDGFITNPNELGAYRIELFRAAHAAGKNITFVGSQTNGPTMVDGVTFPRMHEGHSGFTIDDEPNIGRMGISEPTITDMGIANFRPHIVTLHIGTNDIDTNVDQGNPANADIRLGALMDRILADDPNLLLVVAQLVPTRTDAENVRFQTYNAGIPALVQARAAAGKHIMMVDMYSAFTADPNYKTTLLFDNLHPTIAGYTLMGQVFYRALADILR